MKLILFIVFFSFLSCSYNEKDECLVEAKQKIVTDIIENSIVDFSREINCFDWDSLVFTDPHFDENEFERNQNIKLNGFKLMGFQSLISSDFYTFLIFERENEIVGVIEVTGGIVPEKLVDGMTNRNSKIAKNDAKFKIFKDGLKANGNSAYAIKFENKYDSLKYVKN